MGQLNLNNCQITVNNSGERPLEDYSLFAGPLRDVSVYFRNLESHLVQHIENYPMVAGCVAWLTSEKILKALSKRTCVSVLVQKEDFLRPDMDSTDGWKTKLQDLYKSLPEGQRLSHGDLVSSLSTNGDFSLDGVRCVGICGKNKRAMPRMHHKFLVFCDIISNNGVVSHHKNCAVWTGSFNMSRNATHSFENAVFIENQEIADRYYSEWAQLLALSEPLNWESEYVEPEWRIGS